jgi:hypothetical protein
VQHSAEMETGVFRCALVAPLQGGLARLALVGNGYMYRFDRVGSMPVTQL